LLDYGTKRLLEIEGLKIFGTAKRKPVFHLTLKAFIPMILATIIDKLGIAVRTGHHCAQPIMTFRYPGTIRSFFLYNTKEEIDVMVEAVKRAALMLS
jgi:cysteine desulfurase/selenocysteine lyase